MKFYIVSDLRAPILILNLLTNRAQFNVNRPNNILQNFAKELAQILEKVNFCIQLYGIISIIQLFIS